MFSCVLIFSHMLSCLNTLTSCHSYKVLISRRGKAVTGLKRIYQCYYFAVQFFICYLLSPFSFPLVFFYILTVASDHICNYYMLIVITLYTLLFRQDEMRLSLLLWLDEDVNYLGAYRIPRLSNSKQLSMYNACAVGIRCKKGKGVCQGSGFSESISLITHNLVYIF